MTLDFDVINRELAQYAPDLATKPQVVVLNKTDAIDPKDVAEYQSEFAAAGIQLMTMSAATGAGTDAVLEKLWSFLARS